VARCGDNLATNVEMGGSAGRRTGVYSVPLESQKRRTSTFEFKGISRLIFVASLSLCLPVTCVVPLRTSPTNVASKGSKGRLREKA
jgi:hypothetical protein